MSTGIVICSECKHEVHQNPERFPSSNGWHHCDNQTAICAGAHAAYPESESDIVGKWCGRDGTNHVIALEVPRRHRPTGRAAMLAAALLVASAIPGGGSGVQRRLSIPRGNKYRLCECGSFKPWANCCGAKRS